MCPVAVTGTDLPGLGAPTDLPTTAANGPVGRSGGPDERELGPAMAMVREGRNDEALALIRERAARHPEWPPAPLILARLLLAADQAAPARLALERAAVEAPKDPEVYLTLAAVAVSDGRLSDARLNFDQVLTLIGRGPRDAERARALRREALAGLAAVAEARDDWPAARGALSAWLELEPWNGPARQRLGGVLFQLGRSADAFDALRRAVQDAPDLEPAAVSMARLAGLKGDSQAAEGWYDRAVALEPSNVRARLARAAWLIDQGRAGEARPEVERARTLDPSSHDARRLHGLIAWHLRELPAAEAALDALHRDAPADLGAANLLALCLVEQDDAAKRSRGLQLAEVDAQRAPRSPEVLATLGWARYRAGQAEQAEDLLRAAVEGVRVTPDVAYFLARVLADRGQGEDARKLLRSAIGLPGAFAHREDAKALLDSLAR
jgi:tetratricopeptide (TPR) repeat protein